MDLMKFNKAKCKMLLLGQGNPKNRYSLGDVWIESIPEEKDLGVLVYEKLNTKRLHQKGGNQHEEGGDCFPLLCSCKTSPGVIHPGLGSSAQDAKKLE